MDKKKAVIIVVIILLIISLGSYLIIKNNSSKEIPQEKVDKNSNISKEINLDSDLKAKAMIYVAEKYGYNTQEYLIKLEENDNSYIITIKNKNDNNKIDQITINNEDLKKWQPNTESPEYIEDDSINNKQSSINGGATGNAQPEN